MMDLRDYVYRRRCDKGGEDFGDDGFKAVYRTRSGVAGECQMESTCHAMHCGGGGGGRCRSSCIQSTILRDLGMADITFRELNDIRYLIKYERYPRASALALVV